MRNLTLPTMDPDEVFLAIAAVKTDGGRSGRLNALSNAVHDRYVEYSNNKYDLVTLSDSTYSGTDKEDLEHCYTVSTEPLKLLKAHIRKIQQPIIHNVCQFCGIGPANTFDHYLAKEDFPEYAVFTLNLLPCCGQCNQHKFRTFRAGGERQIINLYFDSLPCERYLFVDIDFAEELPVAQFRLDKPTALDPAVFRRIKSHYDKLNLLPRYKESSVAPISEARSATSKHCKVLTREVVRSFLTDEAERLATDYSPNHWKAVLFDALAANFDFIDSCCQPGL